MRLPRPAVIAAACGLLVGLATAFKGPILLPKASRIRPGTPLRPFCQARPVPKPLIGSRQPLPPLAAVSSSSSSSSAYSRGEGEGQSPQQQQRRRRKEQMRQLARIALGTVAVVAVTGGAARALPQLGAAAQRQLATVAPIARMQDALSQGPLGGGNPVGVLLSWVLDLSEVLVEGVGGVLGVLLWPLLAPLKLLLRTVVLPLVGALGVIARDPQGQGLELVQAGGQAVAGAAGAGAEALAAYLQGVVALAASTLGVAYRFVANALGAFFNMPALQFLDSMDPARHIPAAPRTFVAAQGIKLKSSFGLKEMYGRRWTVHAGRWDWAIPFWERVVMESQLARYQANFPKAAVKARFGFPEIIRGPSPLLGGTFLVLTGIYLLYKGHMTSAIWIRKLQSEAYGKQSWNPVTRLEEEHEEAEGGEGEGANKQPGDEE